MDAIQIWLIIIPNYGYDINRGTNRAKRTYGLITVAMVLVNTFMCLDDVYSFAIKKILFLYLYEWIKGFMTMLIIHDCYIY